MATTSAADIRPAPPGKQARNPISRRQVEAIISRSVAVFGIVFGAQTVPAVLSQMPLAQPGWNAVAVTAVFASLIVALIASLVRRGVRAAHGVASAIYLIALLSWPSAVIDPALVSSSTNHWLYSLLTVATATAAIGFSTWVATAYLFVVPVIYGVLRLTPAGGSVSPVQSTFDVIYAIILGGAVMIIVTMLRQAAASVDSAQATALDRYGHAVRQHATEVERVQVDAIVHDSVLTTLLTAARAYTPEAMALSARNAANAIDHLHSAATIGPDDGTTVRLRDVARRIQDAANGMSSPMELRLRDIGPRSMPIQAAEAVYSAAMQAMVNSLQHAGKSDDVHRWLSIYGVGIDGIQVEMGDNGVGFDIAAVPIERLGVRVSIIDRVANAGGLATIDSAVGRGTTVVIRWPSPESRATPSYGVTQTAPISDVTADGTAR
ncbi:MAG TPA: ATP-binding protein [Glaciihabitans sp.]|jgi:signal transduction histidine kinase|nr:ATP-binding protein [Glaciihabitans sp.]